jgi:hypothetical protein
MLLTTDGCDEASLALLQLMATRLLQLNSMLPTLVYAHPPIMPLITAAHMPPTLLDVHLVQTPHGITTIPRNPTDAYVMLDPNALQSARARIYIHTLLQSSSISGTLEHRLHDIHNRLLTGQLIPPPTITTDQALAYITAWLTPSSTNL